MWIYGKEVCVPVSAEILTQKSEKLIRNSNVCSYDLLNPYNRPAYEVCKIDNYSFKHNLEFPINSQHYKVYFITVSSIHLFSNKNPSMYCFHVNECGALKKIVKLSVTTYSSMYSPSRDYCRVFAHRIQSRSHYK